MFPKIEDIIKQLEVLLKKQRQWRREELIATLAVQLECSPKNKFSDSKAAVAVAKDYLDESHCILGGEIR